MKQHFSLFLSLVTEAKQQIHEITPQALKELMESKKPFTIGPIS